MSCSRGGNADVLAAACVLSRAADGRDGLAYDDLRSEFHRLQTMHRTAVGNDAPGPGETRAAVERIIARVDNGAVPVSDRERIVARLRRAADSTPDRATLRTWERMGDPEYLSLLAERREVIARSLAVPAPADGRWQDPADGRGPERSAVAWAGASPEQRHEWEDRDFRAVGRTAGVPAAVRDRANRRALAQDLTRSERFLAAATRTHENASLDSKDTTRRLMEMAAGEHKVLTVIDGELDRAAEHGVPVQLVRYSAADQGRAVVAVGDLDTAKHVAVLVPGMRTTVSRNLQTHIRDAQAVEAETRDLLTVETGEVEPVATVAWIGYRAPKNLTEAAYASSADRGAVDLRRDLRGIRAVSDATGSRQHLTVLGHSYGSLTAGKALRGDTGVDDAVFMGSPGVGARTTDELHVVSGRVYVEQARHDPVAALHRYRDPSAAGFGATVLATDGGRPNRTGRVLGATIGHEHYYAAGSESLHNLAAVVSGRPGLARARIAQTWAQWRDSRFAALARSVAHAGPALAQTRLATT